MAGSTGAGGDACWDDLDEELVEAIEPGEDGEDEADDEFSTSTLTSVSRNSSKVSPSLSDLDSTRDG